MKSTHRVFATCIVAGAIVAFLIWFLWGLIWQALGLGVFAGLSLYAWMSRARPTGKRDSADLDAERYKHPGQVG